MTKYSVSNFALPAEDKQIVVLYHIPTSFPLFLKVFYDRTTGETIGADIMSPVFPPEQIQTLFADEAGNHPNQRTDEG